MRGRLLNSILFVALAAAGVAAQQFVPRVWPRIEPEGEEFAVRMPETNFRIRRELPFGGGVTLKPASFEIPSRGVLFNVLSFSKSEPGTPKTLDTFAEGFRHALGQGAALEFERDINLDGRAGRQFRLAAGGAGGTARIFETDQRFYVVFTLGTGQSAASAEHFHDSFTFDRDGSDRAPRQPEVEILKEPLKAPRSPWPVVGGTAVYGVKRGDKKGGDTLVPPDSVNKKVISEGVINARALVKPLPHYPAIAKAARATGQVTVQIVVDEEGYVIASEAVSGHPLLQQACVQAARWARFTPMLLDGRPVKMAGVITYNFIIQ